MDRKIIVTGDKSKTLLIPSLNETYHSTKGAYNEAIHVFIEAGLKPLAGRSNVRIFEMGFGTGLNALVSLNYSLLNDQKIDFESIEQFPLTFDLVEELGYPALIEDNQLMELFRKMHQITWNEYHAISSLFNLKKIKGNLITENVTETPFDLIFFDAFGPKVQPDLWSEKMMKKLYHLLKPGGILVTYCAQGQFRRNLKSAGFTYEVLSGPPGKREMTRALKPL